MIDRSDSPLIWNKVDLFGLRNCARELIDFGGDIPVWIFDAPMGAGKTSLIRALGEVYGFTDPVQSPTYGFINEYIDHSGDTYYHFDFYRINDEAEAEDIGVSEYFYSGRPCFIEWPSKIPNLLPEDFIRINIEVSTPSLRQITITRNE